VGREKSDDYFSFLGGGGEGGALGGRERLGF